MICELESDLEHIQWGATEWQINTAHWAFCPICYDSAWDVRKHVIFRPSL